MTDLIGEFPYNALRELSVYIQEKIRVPSTRGSLGRALVEFNSNYRQSGIVELSLLTRLWREDLDNPVSSQPISRQGVFSIFSPSSLNEVIDLKIADLNIRHGLLSDLCHRCDGIGCVDSESFQHNRGAPVLPDAAIVNILKQKIFDSGFSKRIQSVRVGGQTAPDLFLGEFVLFSITGSPKPANSETRTIMWKIGIPLWEVENPPPAMYYGNEPMMQPLMVCPDCGGRGVVHR